MASGKSGSLRVQVASYNINQAIGERAIPSLTPWLVPTVAQDPASGYGPKASPDLELGPREASDIYAIGFQEFAPLHSSMAGTAGRSIFGMDQELRRTMRLHQAVVRPDGKYDSLERGGGPENYARIAQVWNAGVVLYVYARERPQQRGRAGALSAAERVREVRTASVGTGVGQVLGNKGAVGARVVLAPPQDSPDGKEEVLTFVCAHLAAHEHGVDRRNADWRNIVERLVFDPEHVAPLPVLQDRMADASDPLKPPAPRRAPPRRNDSREYSLYDTHYLFAFGDLNYRIATGQPGMEPGHPERTLPPLSKEEVRARVAQNTAASLASLVPYDELAMQRYQTPVRAFHELLVPDVRRWGQPPTYKYRVGNAAAAVQLNGKRLPGWTDRILWTCSGARGGASPETVECELYRSMMEYGVSDHKPITAVFRLAPQLPASTPYLTAPYKVNPRWRMLQWIGLLLDRLVGYIWSLVLLLGAGNLALGLVDTLLLTLAVAWWLRFRGAETSPGALERMQLLLASYWRGAGAAHA